MPFGDFSQKKVFYHSPKNIILHPCNNVQCLLLISNSFVIFFLKSGYAETQESFFIYDVALIIFEDQPFRIGYEARVNPICLPIDLNLDWEKQDYTFTGT